jgi:hypothetical protein
MASKILFRAVIEVLGKPKEHVEESIRAYLDKLKTNQDYEFINEEIAEIKKQEEQDLWGIFAEIEVKTSSTELLTDFCFNYMPSQIEILEPSEMKLSDDEISGILNSFQAKLHQVDMVAKQVKKERDYFKTNMSSLLRNYLTFLLSRKPLTSDQLSKITGVPADNLEDFLDKLIDSGKINLKEGLYSLNLEQKKEENNDR